MRKANVQIARQALVRMAIQGATFHLRHQSLAQTFAESGKAWYFHRHFRRTKTTGYAKADDIRDGQGAAAHAAFMATAVQERLQAHVRVAPTNVQGADTLGPIHLVGGK